MANNKGWIKIWRKVIDNEFCRGDMKKLGFWIWCLSKCMTEEGDYPLGCNTIHLLPGQFVFGKRKAAQETGLSESTVHTYIRQLETIGHVRRHVHGHEYTVIEVLKWGSYQGQEKNHNHDYNHDRNRIKEDKEEYKKNSLSKEREYRRPKEKGKMEYLEKIDIPLNSYERWLMEQQND